MKQMLSEKKLFGVKITTSPERDVLEYVLDAVKSSSEKLSIYTPNPEIIVKASRDREYRDILNSGSILLPDGAGVIAGSWFIGSPLQYRITGIDFMLRLIQAIGSDEANRDITVGFLGAKRNVALRTAECLQSAFPTLKVCFIGEEWPASQQKEGDGVFIPEILQKKIAEKHFGNMEELRKAIPAELSGKKQAPHSSAPSIDILFVAFGAPKQERWISEHLKSCQIKVAMGVGGSFDYISGVTTRAPFLLRFLGLEWLYRLINEPWRWRRQLALITFVGIVVKEWIRLLRSSLLSRKKTA
jgi:N-acetylglucosaminyldiphosphoundecaprenol N-acetyl-beta-D-mannosaminyltransferase